MKIPAQINRKISGVALESDVIPLSVIGDKDNTPDSNRIVGIIERTDGEQRVNQFLGVDHEGIKYVSAFPSPTHLYLSAAMELFEISESRKRKNFANCGINLKDSGLVLLAFENGYTHECFTDFLKSRASSVIMLVSAIENFMNQQIPEDYKHQWVEDGVKKSKGKKKLEDSSFRMKLDEVLPSAIKRPDFWSNYPNEHGLIDKLYGLRKELIHLKSNSLEEWKRYTDTFEQLVDFELGETFNAVILIMNSISEDYIEL